MLPVNPISMWSIFVSGQLQIAMALALLSLILMWGMILWSSWRVVQEFSIPSHRRADGGVDPHPMSTTIRVGFLTLPDRRADRR